MTCIACSVVIYLAVGWLFSFVVLWWGPENDSRPNRQENFFSMLLLMFVWPLWVAMLTIAVLLALPVTLLHASVTGQWLWFWQDDSPEWDEPEEREIDIDEQWCPDCEEPLSVCECGDHEYDEYEYFDPDEEA